MGQKGMIMRNNKLRLHYGNCSMEGKGALKPPQKNLALSRFRIQLKTYSTSTFVAPRVRLGSKMLVEMLDPRIKQLSCTSKHYCFVFLLLIAIQQAWHQGHCMWQVLQQATVAGPVHEVGQPESLGYQSNVP